MTRWLRSGRSRTLIGLCVLLASGLFSGAGSSCGGSSGSGTTPPVTPPAYAAPLPWVYSQIFSAASPFHIAVATLRANGAKVLPQTEMTALWGQGISNQGLSATSYMYPVYVSTATDPVKTFTCGSTWPCDADGLAI